MSRGIFVCHAGALANAPGGVQVCTREYIEVIKAAGVDLRFCVTNVDSRISTRILRRCAPTSYFRPADPTAPDQIRRQAEGASPDFIFFNQVEWAPIAGQIRRYLPNHCKIVILSHGLQST